MVVFFILLSIAIGYALCFATAGLLSRDKSLSGLANRSQRFISLDGLRGFLALGVFYHHVVMTGIFIETGVSERPVVDVFQNLGKVSVALFFIITGFLFYGKLLSAKTAEVWLKLYESRLFRILPLYLFALLLILSFILAPKGFSLDIELRTFVKELIAWLAFHGETINGDPAAKTVISGVDWSLRYEWLFYALLPSLALMSRYRFMIISLVLLTILGNLNPTWLLSFNTKYFLFFAIGGLARIQYKQFPIETESMNSLWGNGITLLLILVVLSYPQTFDLIHSSLIGLLFLCFVNGNHLGGLLKKTPALILGEISYSIYLMHGVLLYIIFHANDFIPGLGLDWVTSIMLGVLASPLLILFCFTTFRFIEWPALTKARNYPITSFLLYRLQNEKNTNSVIAE